MQKAVEAPSPGSAEPGKLLYGQVYEDPEIDLEALQLGPSDRVLAVTSGGCTALRLLAEGPKELVCIDFNPAQNFLFELKLAAIRRLPLADCRRFLGARKGENRLPVYRTLRGGLSPAGRAFWDKRPKLIEKGILSAGATEEMTVWMRRLVFGLIHPPKRLKALLSSKDLAAQADFYKNVWANRRWRGSLHVVFNPLMFKAVYGSQFTRRLGGEDLTRLWIRKIEQAFTSLPVRSNYFLSQVFWGRFLPGEEGLPPYLRQGVFEKVRANADRVRWLNGVIVSFLAASSSGAFTKATLSNAFEWIPLDRSVAAFEALSRAIAPGGRAVLRHLLGVTPVPPGLPLAELAGLSDRLTKEERAFLYTRVSVYGRS